MRRDTTDLLATLKELEARRVSVVALNGTTFDLTTPHGRMIATVLAGTAEFEREVIRTRLQKQAARFVAMIWINALVRPHPSAHTLCAEIVDGFSGALIRCISKP